MTPEEFAKTFAFMASAYPHKEIPDQTWDVYYTMLNDLPAEVFSAAAGLAISRSEFFPTIHALREAASEFHIEVKRLPDPYEAWGMVLSAISYGAGDAIIRAEAKLHPIIMQCVKDIGGWRHIAQGSMTVADRARFIDHYTARASRYREEKATAPPKLIAALSKKLNAGSNRRITNGGDRSALPD